MDLRKLVDRKAGVQEFQESLMLKANTRDTISREEFTDVSYRLDRMLTDLTAKVDGRCNS
jgi:hypothetical protein